MTNKEDNEKGIHHYPLFAYLSYLKNIDGTEFFRIQCKHSRTEPDLKSDVEGIFKEFGLSATEAIDLFYRQVRLIKRDAL